MDAPLQDQIALVTGASSGIGRAIAEALAGAGARVTLVGRSQAPMEETKKKIEEAGGRADWEVLDVREADAFAGLVERVAREAGRLDILVNNAGLSHPGSIADGTVEQWREMLDVNVLSLLVGCQAAIRAMRAHGGAGRIVNVSSIAAQRRDSGVYGATKHAVNCITATLRKELEEEPINVVNVMPGAIATNFARNFDPAFLAGFGKMVGMDLQVERGEKLPDELLEQVQEKLRNLLGSPEDVADAVLYAVTTPPHVNVAEIVVRPPKQLDL